MSDFSNPDDVLFRLLVTVDDVWVGLATLAFTLFLVLLVCGVLFRNREDRPVWLNRLQAWLRAEEMNSALFLAVAALCLIGAGLWLALLLVLVTGLISLLVTVPDLRPSEVKPGDFRFLLAQIAGLTAVLGAVVALPFTVIRMRLSQKQSQTAQAALFNTKITEAAADLHAMRQVSKKVEGKWETVWEDDITRRNAAIDRLEGLVREEPQEAGRVSRLLSVYVRELSKGHPAEEKPENTEPVQLRLWANSLDLQRSDMEHAVQVLGRLNLIDKVNQSDLTIDLRDSNLQAMDLSSLNLSGATFELAKLQGAKLRNSQMHQASFLDASLQGVDLTNTVFEKTDFRRANLEVALLNNVRSKRANFRHARLQGAEMIESSFEKASFRRANLTETQIIESDLTGASLRTADLHRVFLCYSNLRTTSLLGAHLVGADLFGADLSIDTNLIAAKFHGCSVGRVDFSELPQILQHLDDLFGDGSTKLPEGTPWPEHWPKETLDWDDYNTQWRTWAKTKGLVIPD